MPETVIIAQSGTTDARSSALRQGWRLVVMAALMGFASISTDLYLPAMPKMARVLDAGAGSVEWTISGYLIGFSLGQLLWGPIGDRYGRRRPVAAGLTLFVVGSAGCALAGSIPAMIGWRVVQALGACASVVLSRAMVRALLMGPDGAFITGSHFRMDGGVTAAYWFGEGTPPSVTRHAATMTAPKRLPPSERYYCVSHSSHRHRGCI